MPTFATFSTGLTGGMGTFQIDLLQEPGNPLGDHTHSGPPLGGPNTGSTVAMAPLASPGENVAKVTTILPLSYQPLSPIYTLPLKECNFPLCLSFDYERKTLQFPILHLARF